MTLLAKHRFRMPPVLIWLLLWALVGACRAQPPAPPAAAAAAPNPSRPAVPAPASAAPPTPALPAAAATITIVLTPVLGADLAVALDITAHGPADDLLRWTMDHPEPGSISTPVVTDEAGPVPARVTAKPEGWSLQLERRPAGPVRVRYQVKSPPFALQSPLAVLVSPPLMRVSGESVLAIPVAFDRRGVSVELHVRDTGLRGRGAASSFGTGSPRHFRALGRELRAATFIAGGLGTAVFDCAQGKDEMAWYGAMSIDPRPVAGDLAVYRYGVGAVLGQADPRPVTHLLVADARPPGQYVVTPRTAGVLVHMGAGQQWDADLRVSVATQITRYWIGGQLWIGADAEDQQGRAHWFSAGVARFLTRELMFRFGMLSPAEYVSEVNGLLAVCATSPHRGQSNDELARRQAAGEPTLPLIIARGALYATKVDAQIRRATKGTTSLEGLLRQLLERALKERRALPLAAWLEAVEGLRGHSEQADFDGWIRRGEEPKLPTGALGKCFRSRAGAYEIFSLGFDAEATLAAPNRNVVDLDRRGPAYRAGLRDGDVVRSARYRQGNPDVSVELKVEREGKVLPLSYRPVGGTRRGQQWQRVRGIASDQCPR
ncbi:MAG: hypothetical protein JRI68_18795 [Deltaproteobacteria bacterium]|nr:hypothetical protein [Deltaproteobacteria bacterium]